MDATEELRTTLEELEELGTATSRAEQQPEGWTQTPELLRDIERTLLTMSAGFHGVAALAAPTIAALRGQTSSGDLPDTGLSREQEVQLMSVLHDVSHDLAAAARACRNGRSIVEPLIARRMRSGDRNEYHRRGDESAA